MHMQVRAGGFRGLYFIHSKDAAMLSQDSLTHPSSRRNALRTLGTAGLALGALGALPAQSATSSERGLAANQPLAQKNAIITGARNNIGRGIAEGLAALGANVLVHYHKPDDRSQAEETGRLAREAGAGKVAYAMGDLGKPENVRQMFDVAERELGGVDILINNAGAIVKKPIAELTDEEYMRCWNINEWGTFLCMREAANRMNKEGRIINIVTSIVPALTPNYGAYAASKAANAQLVRVLSKEIGGPDRMITVNSVHPGPIDTPFFRGPESEDAIAYATQMANMNRLGQISDVVPLVQFLATPAAQWITGESLFVNGGYLES